MKSQDSHSAERPVVSNGFLKVLVLAGMAGTASLAFPASGTAQTVLRGIQIDMSGIPAGAAETRRDLQACLARALPQAFAGRINASAKTAPVLTVRLTTVWLANVAATSVLEEFAGSTGTTSMDSLEGVAILGGQSTPMIVSANPDFGTMGLPGYNAKLRTDALCTSFAYWLARKI